MSSVHCPGLRGDWLHGWLAAVGAVVRCPSMRLSWTDGPRSVAVLHGEDDVAASIAAALPDEAELSSMAIARDLRVDDGETGAALASMPRKVTFPIFRERAALARQRDDPSLAASVSDLGDDDEVAHSPFDPPVPRGLTLHDRLGACMKALPEGRQAAAAVHQSLTGVARRVDGNGLGFDYLRLPASAEGGELRIDPVVEVLAFFGLTLFSVRGDGRRVRARGWTASATRRRAFSWPLWRDALDRWAVDALLDRWYAEPKRAARYGVTSAYQTVPYIPQGSADTRRAYTSEPVPGY